MGGYVGCGEHAGLAVSLATPPDIVFLGDDCDDVTFVQA